MVGDKDVVKKDVAALAGDAKEKEDKKNAEEAAVLPVKYSINLMWLNKTLVDSQEYILPATGSGRTTIDECLTEVRAWKRANPQALVILWYDSAYTTAQALHNTQAKLKESVENVLLKDIREIPIVRDNPDVFSDYLPIYFRVDLMKFIICAHSIENEGHDSAIFTDFLIGDVRMHNDKLRKLNKSELFSPAILEDLKRYGLKVGCEGGRENRSLENQFFQVWVDPKVLNACKFIVNVCLNTAVNSLNFIQIPDPTNEFSAKERLTALSNFIYADLLRPFLMLCADGTEALQIQVAPGNFEWFNPERHGYDVFRNTVLDNAWEIVIFNEETAKLTTSNNTTLSTAMELCLNGRDNILENTFARNISSRKSGQAHKCDYEGLTERQPAGNAAKYKCTFMPINYERQSLGEKVSQKEKDDEPKEKDDELMEILLKDPERSVRILFYPTTDIEVLEQRRLMLKILQKNRELEKSIGNGEYMPSKERKHFLEFMKTYPNEVVALLQDEKLNRYDKRLMESILTSPEGEQETDIAIFIRIMELKKLDERQLKTILMETDTDIVTLLAICQILNPPQESIDIWQQKERARGEQEEQTSGTAPFLSFRDPSKKSETKHAQERDALRQLFSMLKNERYDRGHFKVLLKQVEVNTKNPNGMTLLSTACRYNAPAEAIETLLKQGADPNIKEFNPKTKKDSTCFEYVHRISRREDIMQLFNKYKDKPKRSL